MLISNSAVGCWTITRRAAKLKPPAVKQKSFELEREVLRFFKAGRKGGPLTSSIESYDKHLKTPQKRRNRPNGQQKPGKVSSLT